MTAVLFAPDVFHIISMLEPEAVAVNGGEDTFRAEASADATSPAVTFSGCPVHAAFVLGPKQVVAVNPPTFRETVPESIARFLALTDRSAFDHAVWFQNRTLRC